MTFGEVNRFIQAKTEAEKRKAFYDYKLADLIGWSCARIQNSSNRMPTIEEAYPHLFYTEEKQEELQSKKDELSAIRFRLFADSYNKRYKEEHITNEQ